MAETRILPVVHQHQVCRHLGEATEMVASVPEGMDFARCGVQPGCSGIVLTKLA